MESLTALPLRALVVDDELVAQKMIVFALESEQFLCDTAYDGEEAFEKFKLLQHDLVVTDLRMPNRDGRHLVLDLTAARPRPTVVVHTADADPGQTRELMAMGVDDIVFKPVHYPAFAAKAHCLVMRRRATSFRPARHPRLARAGHAQSGRAPGADFPANGKRAGDRPPLSRRTRSRSGDDFDGVPRAGSAFGSAGGAEDP